MRLMLMRHANTEVGHGKQDFQRVLTIKGKEEASQAADFLHEYQIDKLLVSFVKRTMQTSAIITEKSTIAETEMVTELYEGDEYAIIDLIAAQEDRNKNLLVIGHNPLIYNVAMSLAKNTSPEYNNLINTAMPTARIIIIEFPDANNWSEIHQQKGDILKIFTPSF